MSEYSFKNEDGTARNTPRLLAPADLLDHDDLAFDERVAASLARLNAKPAPPAPSTATAPAESTLQKVEDAVSDLINKEPNA